MMTDNPLVRRVIRLALEEDIGTGDVTTEAIVPPGSEARAEIVAREEGILAGIPVAMAVLDEVGDGTTAQAVVSEGEKVEPGTVVMRAEGPSRALLVAERTMLDFVMRMSGIATYTRRFVSSMEGTKTVLLDTRKTTPGLRVLEKYAVRVGGAANHRMSLADGVLIKNNHIAVCGDLKEAVRLARKRAPALCRIEVEVRSMEEVKRAVEVGADVLLLDHMDPAETATVVDYCNWKLKTEASGDITPDNAVAMAEAGVDFVSSGALTRSAPWLDFSMYLEQVKEQ